MNEQGELPTHAGRVAVVTGAGRGIGQELCRALAARGADVVGIDVGEVKETSGLVEELGSRWLGLTADVGDVDAVAEAARAVEDRFGGADILVNNAAIDDAVHWDDLDLDLWHTVLQVDLDGPFLLCKASCRGCASAVGAGSSTSPAGSS
jgi:NAD(P)-dependent dehydrogenase (short-subunit alcohol dehydrogenase family)